MNLTMPPASATRAVASFMTSISVSIGLHPLPGRGPTSGAAADRRNMIRQVAVPGAYETRMLANFDAARLAAVVDGYT